MLYSYANSESYRRALEDFDAALAVNPDHTNAQKYTCDTLLALARRYVLVAVANSGCIECRTLGYGTCCKLFVTAKNNWKVY